MSDKKVNVIISTLDDTVPGFKSARHNVQEFASETKKLLAEAFAGFTVFEFFKTAIEKSTEAEQSYVQLSNTLANVGVDYEKNREQIEATIKSLQKVANVRSDEAIKGFNTLVQRSGDYSGSLQNMTLVADLAKAKHLEFNDAAELVGRVMGGNTRVLKQFGIVTKDAADGIAQLKERLHGAAEADLKTFGGQVEATKISFLNMAEAVGDVITNNSTLSGILAQVREGFASAAEWIDKNQSSLGFWFSTIVAGGKEAVRTFIDVGKAAFHLGETIGAVAKAGVAWLKGDTEGTADWMAIAKEASLEVGDSLHDIVLAHDRLSDAIDKAAQKEAEGVKRTEAELDKAKATAAQRLAEREAAAEEARRKEAKARQAEADRIVDETIARGAKAAQLQGFQNRQAREDGIALLNLEKDLLEARIKAYAPGDIERRTKAEEQLLKVMEARKKAGLAEQHPLDALSGAPLSAKNNENQENAEIARRAKLSATELHSVIEGLRQTLATAPPRLGFLDQLAIRMEQVGSHVGDVKSAVQGVGDAFEDVAGGAVLGFGDAVKNSMEALVTHSGNAGEAFRKSISKAIAGAASAKGGYYAAEALAAAGEGLLTFDPSKFAAAAEFTLASAAFYALAGLTGGGSSGGGAGVGGSASSFNSSQSTLGDQNVGSATIIMQGSKFFLDADNPVDRDAFVATWKKALGNREVTLVVEPG